MRITQQIILGRSIASVQQGLGEMARLERQIATGRRVERLSDDPVAGRAILDVDAQRRHLDQLARNIDTAQSRLGLEDATLQSVTGILSRARELGIAQASDTANADSHATAAVEVAELRAAVVQAAGQTVAGVYVFGGEQSDRPPLDATGALDPAFPARGAPRYEVGSGQLAFGAHDAGQIFIDSDVVGALDALETTLATNDTDAIDTATERVRSAISGVQELVAEVGARQARLDAATDARTALDAVLAERRSTLADASISEAVTRLAATQSAFQASLLTTSRILETTLTRYL